MNPAEYNVREIKRGNLKAAHMMAFLDANDFVAAVKKFQSSVGLKADGMCGPKTRAALEPQPAKPPALVDVPKIAMPMRAVRGCEPFISSGWGQRESGFHDAADVMLRLLEGVDPGDSPVYQSPAYGPLWCPGPFIAVQAGQIMKGSTWGIKNNTYKGKSNGWRFWLDVGNGFAWGYFHCDPDGIVISEGDVVELGQDLAMPAGRKYTWPPHVHLMKSGTSKYKPVNPEPDLKKATILSA